jgi:hypothetical protein
MQVIIEEIISNVRAMDRDSVLAPDTLRQIVEACLRAVREERAHGERSAEERAVDGALERPRGA